MRWTFVIRGNTNIRAISDDGIHDLHVGYIRNQRLAKLIVKSLGGVEMDLPQMHHFDEPSRSY